LHTIYSYELDHRAECYGIILFTDDDIDRQGWPQGKVCIKVKTDVQGLACVVRAFVVVPGWYN